MVMEAVITHETSENLGQIPRRSITEAYYAFGRWNS